MTPSIALSSPPPSIGLDGEPETIKEFASSNNPQTSLLVTSPGLGLDWEPKTIKKFVAKQH